MAVVRCSAGFQTCCIADFQIGRTLPFCGTLNIEHVAGFETRDTADLEGCATLQLIADYNRGFERVCSAGFSRLVGTVSPNSVRLTARISRLQF